MIKHLKACFKFLLLGLKFIFFIPINWIAVLLLSICQFVGTMIVRFGSWLRHKAKLIKWYCYGGPSYNDLNLAQWDIYSKLSEEHRKIYFKALIKYRQLD